MKNPSELAKRYFESGCRSDIPIIDTHTHLGPFYSLHLPNPDFESMLRSMDRHNVELIICAPHSSLFVPGYGNRDVEDLMRAYPDRIRGWFCFNPNYPHSLSEIERSFQEYPGYMGFKILPDYHKTRLDSKAYEVVFSYANEHGLPVLSHTWGQAMYDGNVYSTIDMISTVVKRYRSMKFIMGHSVQGQCDEAIALATENDNAFLELTDTYRINGLLEKMCSKAGSHKVLFGTDLPWYSPAYCLGCILFADINDEAKANILRNNILRIIESHRSFSPQGEEK